MNRLRQLADGLTSQPSRVATLLLLWLFALKLSGLYLFTNGFLLSRLSLTNSSECQGCASLQTHKRAVFIIIDALRFDFITPHPPQPINDAYHNVITLPSELSAKYPYNSFIFNAHSDPPTATMQRIKGFTTGSLPTFIDVSSNFGATTIEEDSLLSQLKKSGKRVAFMGDDTWMNLYEDLIDPSMRFPYDSFNVEDLHSVDNGVIEHLFPLLQSDNSSWDVLIGHFLGVDHAGHRVGPGHATMKAKLQQMDEVLRRVVDQLDNETLLVVIGDHGMDPKGDHGGDSILETASAMWVYSKGKKLQERSVDALPMAMIPNVTFPGASVSHRSIQQIDLVPSLSLLLGIPIPFNNLGTVIPELFLRGDGLQTALRLNALQMKNYLQAYRSSSAGKELDLHWTTLNGLYEKTIVAKEGSMETYHVFTRTTLETCRMLWAQFSMTLIILGLIVLLSTLPAAILLIRRLGEQGLGWERLVLQALGKSLLSFLIGGGVTTVLHFMLSILVELPTTLPSSALFGSSVTGGLALAWNLGSVSISALLPSSSALLLILQSILLFSNSFILWEERVITFLLTSSIFLVVPPAISTSNRALQKRVLGYGALFLLCVRAISVSTVCREEQGAYCHVTFYASSVLPSPPLLVLFTVFPMAIILPTVVRRFMRIAAADHGLAPLLVEVYLRSVLIAGATFWYLDWVEGGDSAISLAIRGQIPVRIVRTVIAKTIAWTTGVGLALWSASPLNISVRRQVDGTGHRAVQVIGFANSYGSFYLSFLLLVFSVIWLNSQLSAQLVLALSLVAFLAYLEVVDSVRDIKYATFTKNYRTPTFTEALPIALLSLQVFYATGHQATLSSLQWKSAFIFTADRGITSPITVILNTIGPVAFFALCTPLIGMWAIEPFTQLENIATRKRHIIRGTLRATLSMGTYHATILLFISTCAMILRRHLMVWKVFAPRYMLGALSMVAVDVAGLLAMWGGMGTVTERVDSTYKGVA